jgi:hypothetical protein
MILLLLPLGFLSCEKADQQDPEILEGKYHTNPLLDFRCIALPADQLPTLEIVKNSGNTYDFKLHQYFPEKKITELRQILLEPSAQGFKLRYKNQDAGTWKKEEFLDNRNILTLSAQLGDEFVYFVGEKK